MTAKQRQDLEAYIAELLAAGDMAAAYALKTLL